MAPKKVNTAEAVREAVRPVAESMGLVLWDVVFVKEGPSWFLRITIDKPGGVFIDDCEKLSRAVDPLIDEIDPAEKEYYLEVTSPGLGRTLRTDDHLAAYIGKAVKIRLFKTNADNIRELDGALSAFDAAEITIQQDNGKTILSRKDIADVKADDDRDLFGGNVK